MAEYFKKKLKSLGFPAEFFGLHSLRSGGAMAAANAGVPDRHFKGTAGVIQRTPRMAMLKTVLRIG